MFFKSPAFKILFLLSIFSIGLCSADVVWLKNGDRRDGKIIDESPNMVTFRSASGDLEIRRDLIEKIDLESEEVNHVKIGNAYIEMENYDKAIEEYEQALKINPKNEEAISKLDFAKGKIELMKVNEQTQFEEQVQKQIEQVKVLITKSEFAEALKILTSIEENPLNDNKADLSSLYSDLYYQWGEYKVDRLDKLSALNYYELSIKYNPERTDVQNEIVKILETMPERKEEALQAYKKLLEGSPDRIDLKKKIGDIYYSQNKYEEAIPYYIDVYKSGDFLDTPFAQNLTLSFKNVISTQERDGQYDKAVANTKKYNELFNIADTKDLLRLQYLAMKKNTKEGDIQGRINMLVFLTDNKMDAQAVVEIRAFLFDHPRNPDVMVLYTSYAEKVYKQAFYAYEQGDYESAYNYAQQVIDDYPQAMDVITKASQIMNKSEIKKGQQDREKRDKGKEIADNGQYYYNLALRNIENLKSADLDTNVGIASDKQDAIRNLTRAIELWESAVEIDPSLGYSDSMDLTAKIEMAKFKLKDLEGSKKIGPINKNPKESTN